MLRGTRGGALWTAVLFVAAFGLFATPSARAEEVPAATPAATCGAGSAPETDIQGRVPASDYDSGRSAQGYTCNAAQVAHAGESGGFRVYRYVDAAGHECAYYDTAMLVGTSVLVGGDAGVAVLDMSDSSHPVRTDTLRTPAMLSPHESLNLNQKRGLLAAIMGSPATAPGVVDIYDLTADCRHPALRSSSPVGVAGHEATFAPDGNTLYTTATFLPYVSALDVTNPALPVPVWSTTSYFFHGMNVSDDGTRLYAATIAGSGVGRGLTILDVTQVQQRVPNPTVPLVSFLTWPTVSIPQTAIPISIGGHPYLVEIDEYAGLASTEPSAQVGAGRIIDIANDRAPVVVSDLRLAANQPDARAGPEASDPGASTPGQGYAGHYCAVPQRADPGIVACSFILSGLRVFDIRDPAHPTETAYFNPPTRPWAETGAPSASVADAAPGLFVCRIAATSALSSTGATSNPLSDLTGPLATGLARGSIRTHFAMSAPAFVPERNEVWYSDGFYGFYVVRLTNGVWQPAIASPADAVLSASATRGSADASLPAAGTASSPAAARQPGAMLPATGQELPVGFALAALGVALVGARVRRLSSS